MGRTQYADSGALRIAYELRGTLHARRGTLVLIQGLGFDRTGWGPALGTLQRQLRLVLIDNRGSGRSTMAEGSYGVADMARDVVAVLDHLEVGSAHVLGASLGGMIAQELAVRFPERVDRLVLACTTPGWPFSYPMPAASVRLIAATRRLPPDVALRRHVENALAAATVEHRPDLVDSIVAHQHSRPGRDPRTWERQASAGTRFVGSLRLRRIGARTLVIHGDQDTVVDPRNARLLAERIPQSELAIFAGLGHLFFWEDPAGFVAAVSAFLLTENEPPPPTGGSADQHRAL